MAQADIGINVTLLHMLSDPFVQKLFILLVIVFKSFVPCFIRNEVYGSGLPCQYYL
jgi:hypothetical protein